MTNNEKFLQIRPDKLIVTQLPGESIETFNSKIASYLLDGWREDVLNYFWEGGAPNRKQRFYSVLLRARNFDTQEV